MVVSVKARDPNDTSNNQSMSMKGRQFVIQNRTVEGMLMFAYGMHKKEIVGGPGWIATERWDVQGVPDVPGGPSLKQAQDWWHSPEVTAAQPLREKSIVSTAYALEGKIGYLIDPKLKGQDPGVFSAHAVPLDLNTPH